ncbi:MAG TPA: hypothetical protein VG939_18000 [Caulobacteraceae bacterium]|nr:hypothetical protein [Caulobacteraceae bacterium]
MSEDRRQILGLLADGKITADEADRLLAALGSAGGGSGPPPSATGVTERPSRAKYLRVVVESNEGHEGPSKVNVRVPMQLLRAGVRLSALIPPKAREEVNRALAREGVPFDIGQLKPENLEELIEHLNDLRVDVDSGRSTVRVFCE